MPVERQLKERLIGAAVLVVVAVLLVPEIFSGSAQHGVTNAADNAANIDADSSASSGQLKTYHLQLQDRGETIPAAAVEPSATVATSNIASSAEALNQPSSRPSVDQSVSESADARSSTSAPVALAANMATSSAASSVGAKPAPVIAAEAKPAQPLKKPVPDAKGGWVVQIGSFGAEPKAKQIVDNLKAKDYPAYSGLVTVNGKTLHRVRIGPLAERSAADALLKKLKGAYPDASVVPR